MRSSPDSALWATGRRVATQNKTQQSGQFLVTIMA